MLTSRTIRTLFVQDRGVLGAGPHPDAPSLVGSRTVGVCRVRGGPRTTGTRRVRSNVRYCLYSFLPLSPLFDRCQGVLFSRVIFGRWGGKPRY